MASHYSYTQERRLELLRKHRDGQLNDPHEIRELQAILEAEKSRALNSGDVFLALTIGIVLGGLAGLLIGLASRE